MGRGNAIRIAAVLAAAVVGAGWIAASRSSRSNDRYSSVASYIASERTVYFRLPGSSSVTRERIIHLKGLEFDAVERLISKPLEKDGFAPALMVGGALEPELTYYRPSVSRGNGDNIAIFGSPWYCSEGVIIQETGDASTWELAAARVAKFGRNPVLDHKVPPLPAEVLP